MDGPTDDCEIKKHVDRKSNRPPRFHWTLAFFNCDVDELNYFLNFLTGNFSTQPRPNRPIKE